MKLVVTLKEDELEFAPSTEVLLKMKESFLRTYEVMGETEEIQISPLLEEWHSQKKKILQGYELRADFNGSVVLGYYHIKEE